MSFLANDAINRVNLHSGVQALAQGAAGVFVFVYLLQAGVSLPIVLCVLAVMTAARFILRPLVLPLARRHGVRATLMLGTILEAAIFPLLPLTHGPAMALLVIGPVGSIGSVLYWTSYHAYFASLGDAEHRGGQLGVREAINAIVGIAAPLIGGWALVTLGPWIAFCAAALVQMLAAVPLLGAPKVAVSDEAPGDLRNYLIGAVVMSTDGWLAACMYYLWQLALFVTLGRSFTAYGGAMALAGVVGAICGLGLGRLMDLGHGRRAMLAAYAIVAGVVILRAAAIGQPWLAVTATALGALVQAVQAPAMMTLVYNLAQASPCPLRFHIAAEGGWDIGCCTGCLVAAALTAAGLPLSVPIILGLIGAAASVVLLWRGYGPAAAPATT